MRSEGPRVQGQGWRAPESPSQEPQWGAGTSWGSAVSVLPACSGVSPRGADLPDSSLSRQVQSLERQIHEREEELAQLRLGTVRDTRVGLGAAEAERGM